MTSRFRVRPKAREDIVEIAEYIAADNPDASDRFIDKVFEALDLLSKAPNLGSARRFRRKSLRGIRLWRVPQYENYLLIYRCIKDEIELIRVLHGARNVEKLLRE